MRGVVASPPPLSVIVLTLRFSLFFLFLFVRAWVSPTQLPVGVPRGTCGRPGPWPDHATDITT